VSVIWKSVLVVIGCLVAADIAGAIAVTVFDILPFQFVSAGLAYAIWLVLGAFCGFYAYNIAGAWASPKAEAGAPDWSARGGASDIGTGILITGLVIVGALTALFYAISWRHSAVASDDDYVPDSFPHSIVFFLAVTAALIAARFFLMPTPDKDALSQ
jgi:hypothetical protein